MEQLFLDCEFTGFVQNTSLISLALYRDEYCYFYSEFTDYKPELLTPWIVTNVINKLYFTDENEYFFEEKEVIKMKDSTHVIVGNLKKWLQQFDEIEIWGDVPVYDWVLFCELFGGGGNIPKNVFYIPYDIATLAKIKGLNSDLLRYDYVINLLSLEEKEMQHHALIDAKVESICYRQFIKL
jgi:hypothetical protein